MSTAKQEADYVLEGITKSFGKTTVLDTLKLRLMRGQPTLLLGRNASGKSTLLRIAAGLVAADSGVRKLSDGAAPQPSAIGYFGHQHMLYSSLSIVENLRFHAQLRNLPAALDEQVGQWGLEGHSDKPVHTLSKGLQARAALAATFMHRPEYLFLDEPTSSLDAASIDLLVRFLDQSFARSNPCAIIASHDLVTFERFAKRIVVLDEGKIVADTTLQPREAVVDCYRRSNR